MDPREFHQLATDLVNNSSPSYIRTAISRAYYATFNVSVDIFNSMGFSLSTGPAAHGEIQHLLNNSGNQEVTKVGSQLGDLRSKRIEADYRFNRHGIESQKTAKALVVQAGNMISILDTHCSGPQRSNIIAALKEYKEITGR